VSESGRAVYLDFRDEIEKLGKEVIEDKYGNLFEMYGKITGEDAYQTPMQIYPAVHYIMGGLWVDYSLMSTIPGLFVLGEANFSDHGANRLGASALMQGLGDGYFIIPYTIGDYLAKANLGKITTDAPEFKETIQQSEDFVKRLLAIKGEKTATSFHRELGLILWDYVGMSRTETGLKEALSRISKLREDFWKNLRVSGEAKTLNQQLELAGRVADFLELGQLMTRDALERKESCGGHFREEYQTPDGEAQRDDDNFRHVAAWQYQGEGKDAIFHKETLNFENVSLTQRSYQ